MDGAEVAKTQASTALLCIQLAEEPATRSWVMAVQSLIAFWDGRPTEAVHRATAGQLFASGLTDQLRLVSLEARARARLGDMSGTRKPIGRCQQAVESTDIVRHNTIFDFPAANALRCFGSAYLWVGEHEAAQAALEQALRLFEAEAEGPESYAHVAVTRVDLALAYLGAIDAAEEVLLPVLALGPEHHLSAIVRRSYDLHLALAAPRYTESRNARTFQRTLQPSALSAPDRPWPRTANDGATCPIIRTCHTDLLSLSSERARPTLGQSKRVPAI